jgi:hypothetical protein
MNTNVYKNNIRILFHISLAIFRHIYLILMLVSKVNIIQHAFNNIYEMKFNTDYLF